MSATTTMTVEERRLWLRSQWKFAAIVQFLHIFSDTLRMGEHADFETEDLEDGLITESQNGLLEHVHVYVMRCMTGNRFIASENWIHHLKRLFCDPLRVPDDLLPQQPQITSKSTIEDTGTENNGMQEGENQGGLRALVEKFEDYWAGVAMETRVDVLWALCESCLVDIDRFRSSSKDDDDQIYWRVDPIGWDAENAEYYLFDDNRMYKLIPERVEEPPKPVAASTRRGKRKRTRKPSTPPPNVDGGEETGWKKFPEEWVLVCRTVDDWRSVAAKFQDSSNRQEKALYGRLSSDIVPAVVSAMEERIKEKEQRWAIENRKKSTRLQSRLLQESEEFLGGDDLGVGRRSTRASRRAQTEEREESGDDDGESERERRKRERELRLERRQQSAALDEYKQKHSAMRSKQEGWFFNCFCGVKKFNYDDGEPMMACSICNVWKHIACVDADLQDLGEEIKDWDVEEYVCDKCDMLQQQLQQEKRAKADYDDDESVEADDGASQEDEEGTEEEDSVSSREKRHKMEVDTSTLPKIKLVLSPHPRPRQMPLRPSIPQHSGSTHPIQQHYAPPPNLMMFQNAASMGQSAGGPGFRPTQQQLQQLYHMEYMRRFAQYQQMNAQAQAQQNGNPGSVQPRPFPLPINPAMFQAQFQSQHVMQQPSRPSLPGQNVQHAPSIIAQPMNPSVHQARPVENEMQRQPPPPSN